MVADSVNGFSAKVQEQLKDAQAKATARAKEIEVEARKAFATLSEKAQVELKGLMNQAEVSSRGSLFTIGGELIRLGKHLQEIGRHEAKTAEVKADEAKVEAQA